MKSVNKHGRTRKYINGHSNRKYADPKQYLREYEHRNKEKIKIERKKRRHRKRVELIMYKGGKCHDCSQPYNGKNGSIFEFHHLKEKRFGISAGIADYTMDTLKKEADKCNLVCANCHAMQHSAEY